MQMNQTRKKIKERIETVALSIIMSVTSLPPYTFGDRNEVAYYIG